jgi:MFS family permease
MSASDAAAPGPPAAAPAASPALPSRRTANYSLFVLTVVVMFTVLDRQVLALMIVPLKADFGVSDTRAALLIGAAFSLTYAIAGLPIARIADRSNRRNIVAVCIAFWSAATMACGVAQSYAQMFLARLCIGVGESGYGPATWSIVTDSFPREKVAFATGTLAIGNVVGIGLALFLGGAALGFVQGLPPVDLPFGGVIRPWQWAFVIVGAPGLIWSLVVLTTREPPRQGQQGAAKPKSVPVMDVVRHMGGDWRAYLAVIGGICLQALMALGPPQWTPTLFHRQFDWTLPKIGMIYGAVSIVCGPLGMIAGGKLSERWTRQGKSDANLRIMLYAMLVAVPLQIVWPQLANPYAMLVLIAVSSFVSAMGLGPGIAAFQLITPNPMRAQVSSVTQFSTNVLAFALGPLIVALFTDFLFSDPAALKYSMSLSVAVLGPLTILLIWQGLKPYGRSYERASRAN